MKTEKDLQRIRWNNLYTALLNIKVPEALIAEQPEGVMDLYMLPELTYTRIIDSLDQFFHIEGLIKQDPERWEKHITKEARDRSVPYRVRFSTRESASLGPEDEMYNPNGLTLMEAMIFRLKRGRERTPRLETILATASRSKGGFTSCVHSSQSKHGTGLFNEPELDFGTARQYFKRVLIPKVIEIQKVA